MNPWAISANTPLIVIGMLGTIGGAMVFQLMMIQKYYYYMVCVALAATVALKPLVDKVCCGMFACLLAHSTRHV
jgi:hypothetical protein